MLFSALQFVAAKYIWNTQEVYGLRGRYNTLMSRYADLVKLSTIQVNTIIYLADMMERNDIPMSEFDAIALTLIAKQ